MSRSPDCNGLACNQLGRKDGREVVIGLEVASRIITISLSLQL